MSIIFKIRGMNFCPRLWDDQLTPEDSRALLGARGHSESPWSVCRLLAKRGALETKPGAAGAGRFSLGSGSVDTLGQGAGSEAGSGV